MSKKLHIRTLIIPTPEYTVDLSELLHNICNNAIETLLAEYDTWAQRAAANNGIAVDDTPDLLLAATDTLAEDGQKTYLRLAVSLTNTNCSDQKCPIHGSPTKCQQ